MMMNVFIILIPHTVDRRQYNICHCRNITFWTEGGAHDNGVRWEGGNINIYIYIYIERERESYIV